MDLNGHGQYSELCAFRTEEDFCLIVKDLIDKMHYMNYSSWLEEIIYNNFTKSHGLLSLYTINHHYFSVWHLQ